MIGIYLVNGKWLKIQIVFFSNNKTLMTMVILQEHG